LQASQGVCLLSVENRAKDKSRERLSGLGDELGDVGIGSYRLDETFSLDAARYGVYKVG